MQSGIRYYFLGADSRCGYYSLYGSLLSSAACETQYIIKGGHSLGKSIFLKTLMGLYIENGSDIQCFRNARDSEALSGIYVPALKTVFLDGEMPHAVNAQYPGAVETYIDLGALYNLSGLKKKREAIVALTKETEKQCGRLCGYIRAAAELRDNILSAVSTEKTIDTIKGRAGRNAVREFKRLHKQGEVSYRFLTTSSGEDRVPDFTVIIEQYRRICVLDNDFGLSAEMLSVTAERAAASGYSVTACLDPLEPERIEHLLIPELSLAYISKTGRQEFDGEVYKHFRFDALAKERLTSADKIKTKSDRKLFSEILSKAGESREEIKRLNDELGQIYTAQFDRAAAEKLAEGFL